MRDRGSSRWLDGIETDAALEALAGAERAHVARVWQTRARNERRTSQAFEHIRRGAMRLRAEPAVLELAARAVGDELEHAELCERVAARYAVTLLETETSPAHDDVVPEPCFNGCTERECASLSIVLHCCLNETIAAAYLKQCLLCAQGPLVRAAVRTLLSDEVEHARIGWAHLNSTRSDAAARRLIAEAMPELLRAVHHAWTHDPTGLHDLAPSGHGSMPIVEVRTLVLESVQQLIIPGLSHVGIDPHSAHHWLTAQQSSM